jgi:signal transduction histidine kinase
MRDDLRQEEVTYESHRLESLGLWTGAIAHDFNNLLLAMSGLTETALLMQGEGQDPTPQLLKLQSAIARSRDLVQELLDYARHRERTMEPIDLSQLAEEMAALIGIVVPKRIQLSLELGAELPRIRGDRAPLQQVVLNLLTNAVDAIGDSQGHITLRTALEPFPDDLDLRQQVEAHLPPSAHCVTLEVRDSGCGMEPHVLARIFTPLFTTKPNGRGLGLSILQEVIRTHKGALAIDSTPGAGTAFRIHFPVLAE